MSKSFGPHIVFLDMDGVVFHPGTDDFKPGVLEKLQEWSRGDTKFLYAFTARPMGPWLKVLRDNGVTIMGYMQKPLASEYSLFEDHLVEGRQAIACQHKNLDIRQASAPDAPPDAKAYCLDCDIYLYEDEWRRTAPDAPV
jgi:hypothetical protein